MASASAPGLTPALTPAPPADDLERFYAEGLEEQARLRDENALLQREARRLLRLHALQAKLQPFRDHGQRTEAELMVRYHQSLSDIDQCRVDLAAAESRIEQDAAVLRGNLEAVEGGVAEASAAFDALRGAVAGSLERAHGVLVTPAQAAALEDQLRALALENDALRLQALTQREKIAHFNAKSSRAHEAREKLRRIDYEQTKIENQTLAEKIEERSEELLRLRRRTVTTLQILAHVREKRHFVQSQVAAMKRELLGLDEQLGTLRDRLSQLKTARTSVRRQADDSRDQTGLSGNQMLVDDYRAREALVGQLHEDVARAKERYEELCSKARFMEGVKRRIVRALELQ